MALHDPLGGGEAKAHRHARRFRPEAELAGGIDPATKLVRTHKHVVGKLVVPPVPCQTVLDAFPEHLLPYLQGFKLGGTFSMHLDVDVDRGNLEQTILVPSRPRSLR